MSQSLSVQDDRLQQLELSRGGAGSSWVVLLPPRLSNCWNHLYGSSCSSGWWASSRDERNMPLLSRFLSTHGPNCWDKSNKQIIPHTLIGEGRLSYWHHLFFKVPAMGRGKDLWPVVWWLSSLHCTCCFTFLSSYSGVYPKAAAGGGGCRGGCPYPLWVI